MMGYFVNLFEFPETVTEYCDITYAHTYMNILSCAVIIMRMHYIRSCVQKNWKQHTSLII